MYHTIFRCLLFAALSSFAFAQARIEIPGGTSFDFGEVWTSSAKKVLTLRNRGKDTLRLSNLSASCGCTGTLLSDEDIAPGKSASLEITFDANRFNGPVEKYLAFETNDSSQKRVNITFRAKVMKTLEFDPEYFYFSTFPDSVSTREITVKNASEIPIHILSITSPSQEFVVKESAREVAPGEEIQLLGTLRVRSKGTTRGEITITTDHPKINRYILAYFALVKEKK